MYNLLTYWMIGWTNGCLIINPEDNAKLHKTHKTNSMTSFIALIRMRTTCGKIKSLQSIVVFKGLQITRGNFVDTS